MYCFIKKKFNKSKGIVHEIQPALNKSSIKRVSATTTKSNKKFSTRAYAILLPLDRLMQKVKKSNIIGDELSDLFIKKSVALPEGSVIIKRNPG